MVGEYVSANQCFDSDYLYCVVDFYPWKISLAVFAMMISTSNKLQWNVCSANSSQINPTI